MNVAFDSNASTTRRLAGCVLPGILALLIAVAGICAQGSAQTPAPPAKASTAQASTTPQQTPQSQADVEWLTAYMMAHEGYRLDHMSALEKSFTKMSPTQLHTLREFYERKHAMVMQQKRRFARCRQQVSMAQAYQQQQRSLNQFTQEESQAADAETRRINQMHEEAAANAGAARNYGPHIYPSPGYGGYPFGPYGGSRYPY
jgi:exonuclease VII large subunit